MAVGRKLHLGRSGCQTDSTERLNYDGLQPRQPGEHPYRAADADGKEQWEGGVMYLIEDMIDMGLKAGQKWPSAAHRKVASTLVIGNPLIRTRDALTEIVQKVCKIPKTKIKKVGFY